MQDPPSPTKSGILKKKKTPKGGRRAKQATQGKQTTLQTPQDSAHSPPLHSFVTDGRLENLGNNYAIAGYYYMEINKKKLFLH